jgi:hypothetical protein
MTPQQTSVPASHARRNGLTKSEKPDAIGLAVATLNKLAQSPLLDRLKMRKAAERSVFEVTKSGFRTAGAVSRQFTRAKGSGSGAARPTTSASAGLFDLTPTEDEQMLVDVVTEFATEVIRPAAADANEACLTPAEILAQSVELGLPLLGVPESLGGISGERAAMASALVAEALAHGDMGIAVAALAPGAVATALGLWGDEEQQATYLPAFTGADVPVAALALAEARVLFDPLAPATIAERTADGFVLNGAKSQVVRASEAEVLVVGALLDGEPRLFIVESGSGGVTVESDPSMGLRAASLGRVTFTDTPLPASALLGTAEDYVECVRLSRVAWAALSLGTGQAVLDYVIPYVNERVAFGEPISHRQGVAFIVADMAIELQAMRLVTYRAASRAGQGKDFTREAALARRICAEKGMKIGNDGVQLLGGHGFVKEHPVERWYRDMRAIGLMEGGVLI